MQTTLLLVGALLALPPLRAADTVKMLKPSGEIRRADFRCLSFSKRPPSAVLVLCPGQNGDGADFLA
ncbi:MAG: hypothetical protein WC076_13785, partial [Terrimicrobiaceae bacterium]